MARSSIHLYTAWLVIPAFTLLLNVASSSAATLAHWRLNENTSGRVDPAAGFQSTTAAVPGAPFAPTLDSAGNPSRDMARLRDYATGFNFRNSVVYDSLAGHTTRGFVGTATYHLPYPTQDLRGVYSGNDGTDVLTSRGPDAFTNADLSGGFTYEVLWRPGIAASERLNFDISGNVVMNNNTHAVVATIEGFVQIGFRDGDPSAAVDPRIFFTIAGTAGSATETTLDLALLKNSPDRFLHVVGVYDPSAAQKQRLYVDGVLVSSSNAFALSNIDGNNGGSVDFRYATIGGAPSPSNAFTSYAFIDAVRLSTGAIPDIHWLIPLPEPSALAIAACGASMLLRRRSRVCKQRRA